MVAPRPRPERPDTRPEAETRAPTGLPRAPLGRPAESGSIAAMVLWQAVDDAERKAWDSLARYKFQMFGYWAAIWVHLNHLSGLKRPNPWKGLVHAARKEVGAR